MAEISNEQLYREISELKGLVDDLQQGIHRLLPPLQEMEISRVARGGPQALANWNARKKAGRKQN